MPGNAYTGWTVKKEKDGIVVYSRHSELSKFNDIRVSMDLPGTVEQLSVVLLDVDKYTSWVYATKSSEMVKKITDNEVIYYAEVETPWPAANRDYYADVKATLHPENHTLIVESAGIKDYKPEKKDLVRVPMSKGHWIVTTTSGNHIHLDYILQLDPGGSTPAWVLNSFAAKAPLETFANLKKKMEELNSN
jgi:START domain